MMIVQVRDQPTREQPITVFTWISICVHVVLVCVCVVLVSFEAVPSSHLIVAANDTELLQTVTSDITSCVRGKHALVM